MKEEESDFMRVAAAAEYVGVSAQTLRRWDRDGRVPAVKRPGSTHRYYRRAVSSRELCGAPDRHRERVARDLLGEEAVAWTA